MPRCTVRSACTWRATSVLVAVRDWRKDRCPGADLSQDPIQLRTSICPQPETCILNGHDSVGSVLGKKKKVCSCKTCILLIEDFLTLISCHSTKKRYLMRIKKCISNWNWHKILKTHFNSLQDKYIDWLISIDMQHESMLPCDVVCEGSQSSTSCLVKSVHELRS